MVETIDDNGQATWQAADRVSLDKVRGLLIGSQTRKPTDAAPSERVVVHRNGTIGVVAGSSPALRPVAEVTPEVFASARPSLDRIRDQMLTAQRTDSPRPASPREKIVADRNGRIGFEQDLADGRALSEVTQEVFAARLDSDRATVQTHLPPSTTEVVVDGITGWTYSFANEFGRQFTMWAFFDGALYQAVLVAPQVESRGGAHDKHLFYDGYICLSPRGGCRTLQDTYARSVVWANGYTVYEQTGQFPFSVNNL